MPAEATGRSPRRPRLTRTQRAPSPSRTAAATVLATSSGPGEASSLVPSWLISS